MTVFALLAVTLALLVAFRVRRAGAALRRDEEAYWPQVDNRPALFDWAEEGDL